MCDIKSLEILAATILEDAKHGWPLNPAAMRSIADIIQAAIGAPLDWPSRVAGADRADELYPSSPSQRLAFNTGVKWAVEHYGPTVAASDRYHSARPNTQTEQERP